LALLGERETLTVFALFLSALARPAQPQAISERAAHATTAKTLLFFREKSELENIKALLPGTGIGGHTSRTRAAHERQKMLGLETKMGLLYLQEVASQKYSRSATGQKGSFLTLYERTGSFL
jgi:hypothetical protein